MILAVIRIQYPSNAINNIELIHHTNIINTFYTMRYNIRIICIEMCGGNFNMDDRRNKNLDKSDQKIVTRGIAQILQSIHNIEIYSD